MRDPSHYERRTVARILELTACNQKGIEVIAAHLESVMSLMDAIMRIQGDSELL